MLLISLISWAKTLDISDIWQLNAHFGLYIKFVSVLCFCGHVAGKIRCRAQIRDCYGNLKWEESIHYLHVFYRIGRKPILIDFNGRSSRSSVQLSEHLSTGI